MSLNTACFGYHNGLRQPGSSLALLLPLINDVDYELVDARLEEIFGVDMESQPSPSQNGSAAKVSALAWRVLLTARTLQQAAFIPIFETGRVLTAKQDTQQPSLFRVTVAAPVINQFPHQEITRLYQTASQVVRWAAKPQIDPPELENLQRHVHENVIPRMRSIVQTGISTLPILNCAYQNNIPFSHIGAGVFQLGWGKHVRLMDRSSVDTDSAIGAKLAHKKHWAAQLLRSGGLPAPEHHLINSFEAAKQAAEKLGWPLVVKPADCERSEGVTIDIRDMQKLQEGFEAAASKSCNILVERQVPGICYRLLIANGKLLYVLSRKPKAVVGDGQNSIAELLRLEQIAMMNKSPWRRGKYIEMDVQTTSVIAAQGFTPDSIPGAGVEVALRDIESSEWGGNIGDASAQAHPDNVDIAVRAARLFGLSIAGIDIISSDIARPWHENGAIINEVNFTPYLGGNPIARARLPDFFEGLVKGDGRIPVIIYVGGEAAWQAGLTKLAAQREAGIHFHLTSHAQTLNAQQKVMHFPGQSLFRRALALLANRDVEALILVIQTDELLQTGLPIDQIDEIHICSGTIAAGHANKQRTGNELMRALQNLLGTYKKCSARQA